MDDWPSHTAELTRKTTDQLNTWSERYDRGIINLKTFLSVVSALYDTTSGMIATDVSALLANIHRDLLAEAKRQI